MSWLRWRDKDVVAPPSRSAPDGPLPRVIIKPRLVIAEQEPIAPPPPPPNIRPEIAALIKEWEESLEDWKVPERLFSTVSYDYQWRDEVKGLVCISWHYSGNSVRVFVNGSQVDLIGGEKEALLSARVSRHNRCQEKLLSEIPSALAVQRVDLSAPEEVK